MNEANCSRANCPHGEMLERARAACGGCHRAGCAGCPNERQLEQARAACLKCPRGGRPAGHGGTISADAAGEGIVHREALRLDRSPRGRVTELPQEVEGVIAELFRRWCGLDTIDALLALHVCNGGTCKDFGAYLLRVREAITELDPTRPAMRATAWCKFKTLVKRTPLLEKVKTWANGHGGAVVGQGKGLKHKFKSAAAEALRVEREKLQAERQRLEGERARRREELERARRHRANVRAVVGAPPAGEGAAT